MIRFYPTIVFLALFAFIVSSCKPIDQQQCPAVEKQKVVLNSTGELLSKQVQCDSNVDSKIERIQRVFMHSPVEFSFMVEAEEGKRSIVLWLRSNVLPEFIWDVPRGESAYAFCRTTGSGDFILEMHLYSKDQVEGAGWDQGKFGSGQTVVVPMERP